MNASHHPDPATLTAYAAGTLDEAFAVIVSCHLENCSKCREDVAELELLGGATLDAIEDVPMSAGAFGRALEKVYVDAPARDQKEFFEAPAPPRRDGTPSALSKYLEKGVSNIDWKRVSPGIWQKKLTVSQSAQSSLRLLKIASGKKVPEHGHGGHEITMILSGAYRDEIGYFGKGDVADLDHDIEHQPFVVSDSDCICLVATEAPTKFKSLAGRVFQPFVGI